MFLMRLIEKTPHSKAWVASTKTCNQKSFSARRNIVPIFLSINKYQAILLFFIGETVFSTLGSLDRDSIQYLGQQKLVRNKTFNFLTFSISHSSLLLIFLFNNG